MKKLFISLFFCLISSQLIHAQALSLQECVEIAVDKHPDYQESILNAEMAQSQLALSKSRRLPSMNMQVYQSTNTGRSIDRFTNAYINQVYNSTYAQASLQQPIFQGFKIKHDITSKELSLKSSLYTKEATKNSMTIRVIQAYLNVLQSQELSRLADVQLEASQKQLDRMDKQVQAGVLGKRDLLQLQTQVANDEFALIGAKGVAKQARLTLFQLLNSPPDENVSFDKIDSENALGKLQSIDRESVSSELPEMLAAKAQINAYDVQIKSIKAENLPAISFSANYNTFFASSNPDENFLEQLNGTRNGSFTLGLQIPIFGSLQTNPRIQSTTVQKKLAQNQLKNANLLAQNGYALAIENYKLAAEQYENAQRQLAVNEENMAAVLAQINAGTVNTLEYILAKNNQDKAKSNHVQAKYALILQEKIVGYYQNGNWQLD
ncbi:TolC family protein [Marinilongibacter aquaticus]|uniref:TolC family protein n=1 Tax=Marinilongibacter aquaticus TaxID=2975157 RepID=UPI0021BD751E|nr:TolC family protein [Marinilongibacter aquaticus]UBM57301.1 TolC family protein [Marinilongibacter aquaticus]